MKNHRKYIRLLILIGAPLFYSCFPTYQANQVKLDKLSHGHYANMQAKLFTQSNEIVLFPNGFKVENEKIIGKALSIKFGSNKHSSKDVEIKFDSILAIITYEETTTGTRHFGNFLLGLTGPPLTFLGVYCLACPKCCFGSCPTVYINESDSSYLKAELFSEAISKQLQSNDLDLLKENISSTSLKIKITNEALETHYIDKFELLLAEHPLGTKVYQTNNDDLTIIKSLSSILRANTKEGNNITGMLSQDDGKYYRSGVEKTTELRNGPVTDFIEIRSTPIKNRLTKMIIKYRNTLLSTTLLYDVVLGSQGIDGLSWTKRMNEDQVYASQFKLVYDTFSGINIKVFDNGIWKTLGKLKDAGPLSWKEVAVEIPAQYSSSNVRLEFVPDNFMIDYVAFDTTLSNNIEAVTSTLSVSEIRDGNGNTCDKIQDYIQRTDQTYLKTEPGDSYSFIYKVAPKKEISKTAFVRSSGYYNEWIRGSWISNKSKDYAFNLYNVKETLSYLVDCWQENYSILEEEFNNSRVKLRGSK